MNEILELTGEKPLFQMEAKYIYEFRDGTKYLIEGEALQARFEAFNLQVGRIFQLGHRVATTFIEIGQLLLKLKEEGFYFYVHRKAESYSDIFSFAYKVFGFSKSTTYGMMSVAERFVAPGGKDLYCAYEGFSYSALVEMLPLPPERIKLFTPEVRVSEIRELRKGWEKYGYESGTWQEELHRIRELEAKEEAEQKKGKEKKKGLLSLLNDTPPAAVSSEETKTEEPNTEQSAAVVKAEPLVPCKRKLILKNDEERRKFLTKENAMTWPKYLEIPALKIVWYRYEFANGAQVLAEIGGEYDYRGIYHDTGYFRLHLISKMKPFYEVRGNSTSDIVAYMKTNKNRI